MTIFQMKIDNQLNEILTNQAKLNASNTNTKDLLMIAKSYAIAENAIAVLSDMKEQCSDIFYGKAGEFLGIAEQGAHHHIPSIWEEEIMSRIHPDDLIDKQADELKFYYFLRNMNPNEVADYVYHGTLRMKDNAGQYHLMDHRISYLHIDDEKHIRFALCIYTILRDNSNSKIYNTSNQQDYHLDEEDYADILSKREKEILMYINMGMSSKEIANQLKISFNTVSRHRANIREKLNAQNTVETLQIAKKLKMLPQ